MNKKQAIGIAMILFGAAGFGIGLFQLNSYISLNGMASYAAEQSAKKFEQLKNDPAQLATLGITAAELEQYGPQLLEQVDTGVQVIYQKANSIFVPILLDFAIALALAGGGAQMLREH